MSNYDDGKIFVRGEANTSGGLGSNNTQRIPGGLRLSARLHGGRKKKERAQREVEMTDFDNPTWEEDETGSTSNDVELGQGKSAAFNGTGAGQPGQGAGLNQASSNGSSENQLTGSQKQNPDTGSLLSAVFYGSGDIVEQCFLFLSALQNVALFVHMDIVWPQGWLAWMPGFQFFSFGALELVLPHAATAQFVASLLLPILLLLRFGFLHWQLSSIDRRDAWLTANTCFNMDGTERISMKLTDSAKTGVNVTIGTWASVSGRWGEVTHEKDYDNCIKLRWIEHVADGQLFTVDVDELDVVVPSRDNLKEDGVWNRWQHRRNRLLLGGVVVPLTMLGAILSILSLSDELWVQHGWVGAISSTLVASATLTQPASSSDSWSDSNYSDDGQYDTTEFGIADEQSKRILATTALSSIYLLGGIAAATSLLLFSHILVRSMLNRMRLRGDKDPNSFFWTWQYRESVLLLFLYLCFYTGAVSSCFTFMRKLSMDWLFPWISVSGFYVSGGLLLKTLNDRDPASQGRAKQAKLGRTAMCSVAAFGFTICVVYLFVLDSGFAAAAAWLCAPAYVIGPVVLVAVIAKHASKYVVKNVPVDSMPDILGINQNEWDALKPEQRWQQRTQIVQLRQRDDDSTRVLAAASMVMIQNCRENLWWNKSFFIAEKALFAAVVFGLDGDLQLLASIVLTATSFLLVAVKRQYIGKAEHLADVAGRASTLLMITTGIAMENEILSNEIGSVVLAVNSIFTVLAYICFLGPLRLTSWLKHYLATQQHGVVWNRRDEQTIAALTYEEISSMSTDHMAVATSNQISAVYTRATELGVKLESLNFDEIKLGQDGHPKQARLSIVSPYQSTIINVGHAGAEPLQWYALARWLATPANAEVNSLTLDSTGNANKPRTYTLGLPAPISTSPREVKDQSSKSDTFWDEMSDDDSTSDEESEQQRAVKKDKYWDDMSDHDTTSDEDSDNRVVKTDKFWDDMSDHDTTSDEETYLDADLLDLYGKRLGAADAAVICAWLNTAGGASIKRLNLLHNPSIGDDGLEKLIAVLPSRITTICGLQKGQIEVDWTRMDTTTMDCKLLAADLKLGRIARHVKRLNLLGCPIDDAGLTALAEAALGTRVVVSHVQTLCGLQKGQTELDWTRKVRTPMDCRLLAADLKLGRRSNTLRHLNLLGCPIDDAGLMALAEAAEGSNIQTLCGLESGQSVLDWSNTAVLPTDFKLLAADLALARIAASLDTLLLNECKLRCTAIDPDGTVPIGSPIKFTLKSGVVSRQTPKLGSIAALDGRWGEVIGDNRLAPIFSTGTENHKVILRYIGHAGDNGDPLDCTWTDPLKLYPIITSARDLIEDYSHLEALGQIAAKINKLQVSKCQFSPRSLMAFLQSVPWGSSSLVDLDLADNPIGNPKAATKKAGAQAGKLERGQYACYRGRWGKLLWTPCAYNYTLVSLRWLDDGTESFRMKASKLGKVVPLRSDLVEDYGHLELLGQHANQFQQLSISNCKINAGLPPSILASMLKPRLVELNIGRAVIGNAAELLIEELKVASAVEYITLGSDLRLPIKERYGSDALKIRDSSLDSGSLKVIAWWLSLPVSSAITSLDLSTCVISDAASALTETLTSLKAMKTVFIGRDLKLPLKGKGYRIMDTKNMALDLGGYQVVEWWMRHPVSVSLNTLILDGCTLSGTEVKSRGTRKEEVLRYDSELHPDVIATSRPSLFAELCVNFAPKLLVILSLRNCYLGPRDVTMLAQTVSGMKTLEELILAGNPLGAPYIRARPKVQNHKHTHKHGLHRLHSHNHESDDKDTDKDTGNVKIEPSGVEVGDFACVKGRWVHVLGQPRTIESGDRVATVCFLIDHDESIHHSINTEDFEAISCMHPFDHLAELGRATVRLKKLNLSNCTLSNVDCVDMLMRMIPWAESSLVELDYSLNANHSNNIWVKHGARQDAPLQVGAFAYSNREKRWAEVTQEALAERGGSKVYLTWMDGNGGRWIRTSWLDIVVASRADLVEDYRHFAELRTKCQENNVKAVEQ